MHRRFRISVAIAILFTCFALMHAENTPPFDLKGPNVEVRVTRGGKTLPIAQVPNLLAGDRIRIHPDLPDTQSVHYLLIIAFLRGVTNPPPVEWFTKAETWKAPFRDEGIEVVVPAEAQQAAIFLAPETSGDIKTLRTTVRDRPGSFVRVIQDLNQASLDRARVDAYLEAMRRVPQTDEDAIKKTSTTLARSLSLKINQDCFLRATSEQAQCLTQNSDQLVVDTGQSASMVAQLTSGATSDLATQLAYTPTAGAGYYSAYVGAVFDVARILDGLHTAKYQYIPALFTDKDDTMETKLNNPPSFHNPKSVIVIALPPIESVQLPRLSPVNPKEAECLQKPHTLLGMVGDPALFATEYGHGFVLHFEDKQGKAVDLPATPDATLGGFKVDGSKVDTSHFGLSSTGHLKGFWGFDAYEGPSFTFDLSHASQWKAANGEQTALVVGRTDTLHLEDDEAACVSEVELKTPGGSTEKVTFKVSKPSEIEVQVPLKDATPGAVSLLVREWGLSTTDEVSLHSYAEAGHLDKLTVYAGDPDASLSGSRLDEVSTAEINGVSFHPDTLSRHGEQDELKLVAANAAAVQGFTVGLGAKAKFTLKDGRTLELPLTVAPPRPRVTILSRDVQVPSSDAAIHLTDQGEVPQAGGLTFSLKTVIPQIFPRTEKIEVSSDDGSLTTTLSLSDSSLVLEDATTMLATLDPLKSFGPSIFGPLRFRPVAEDGTTGDWQSLGTVVRLPVVSSITCPRVAAHHVDAPVAPPPPTPAPAAPATPAPDAGDVPPLATLQPGAALTNADTAQPVPSDPAATACTLHGSNLFLIDSVASDGAFTHSTQIPEGFSGTTISVPRPVAKTLYVKLRDDPTVVNTLAVPHD
jgi:hypothetical protein